MREDEDTASELKIKILFLKSKFFDHNLSREFSEKRLAIKLEYAISWNDFVQKIAYNKTDIVLLDYQFDKPNIFEVFTFIKEQYATLPFIVINGPSNEKTIVECIKAGAFDYISVVNPARLTDTIKSAIKFIKLKDDSLQLKNNESESDESFPVLFNSIDEGFCIIEVIFDESIRPVDCLFLEVNHAFENQTGLSDVKGKTIRSFSPGHEEHWLDIYGNVALTGEPKRFLNRADQLDRWYDVYAFRIGKREDHRVGVLFNDITEKKRMAEDLHKSEELLRLALLAGGHGLFDFDIPGRFAHVNSEYLRIIGYLPDEIQVTYEWWVMSIHPDDRERAVEKMNACITGQKDEYKMEFRQHTKSGNWVWVLCQGRNIEYDEEGRPTRMLGTHTNITEQKYLVEKLEDALWELERSNKDLEQFAYVASHDLQEPLRMIISYMKLFETKYSGLLDEKAKEYIGFAIEGSKRMSYLIKDLLTYSRIKSEPKDLAGVNLNDILKDVLDDLQLAIKDSKAIVNAAVLPTVKADPVQMRQLFQNLISNAIKFRRSEVPPVISIKADNLKDKWLISIQDNSIGIMEEYFGRIFQIFQRLHDRDKYPGTGIGLAVCKKIVERHGGNIWVESEEGKGSTFYITLPLKV